MQNILLINLPHKTYHIRPQKPGLPPTGILSIDLPGSIVVDERPVEPGAKE